MMYKLINSEKIPVYKKEYNIAGRNCTIWSFSDDTSKGCENLVSSTINDRNVGILRKASAFGGTNHV